jgi:hypothetical protein
MLRWRPFAYTTRLNRPKATASAPSTRILSMLVSLFSGTNTGHRVEVVGNLFASRAPTGPRQHALVSRHKPVDLLGEDVGDAVGVALTEQPEKPPAGLPDAGLLGCVMSHDSSFFAQVQPRIPSAPQVRTRPRNPWM